MADLPTGRPAGDSEQAGDVGDERAELRRRNLLGRIGQGVLRRRMRLHDQAISTSGNYGEIFERNVGEKTPLALKRGPNAQWAKGGLQYAPPIR